MTYTIRYWEKYFPDFALCEDTAVMQLMQTAQIIEIPVGKIVFSPGDVCQNYLLLLKGQVKIQLLSETGREVLLYAVNSGDSCVLTTSCLLANDYYPAEGIVTEQVKAFLISSANFHHTLEQSAFFRQFVFKNFSNRLSDVISRMGQIVFGSVDQRLCTTLLGLDNQLIKLTHQELANQLGTAREVISRHLKRYEAAGWIELNRGSITILDCSALQQMAQALNNKP